MSSKCLNSTAIATFKEFYKDYDWDFNKQQALVVYRRLMNFNLVYFPDESLSTPTSFVTEFNSDLDQLIQEMKVIMEVNNGIGLSANQIGHSKSVIIVRDNKGIIHEMVNPVLIESEGEVTLKEGCLSSPGIFLPIKRAENVLIQYQDKTGENKRIMAEGMEARCLLHELEHLKGESFLDHTNRATRKSALSQIKKYKKNNVD